jgi:hypothetical protein
LGVCKETKKRGGERENGDHLAFSEPDRRHERLLPRACFFFSERVLQRARKKFLLSLEIFPRFFPLLSLFPATWGRTPPFGMASSCWRLLSCVWMFLWGGVYLSPFVDRASPGSTCVCMVVFPRPPFVSLLLFGLAASASGFFCVCSVLWFPPSPPRPFSLLKNNQIDYAFPLFKTDLVDSECSGYFSRTSRRFNMTPFIVAARVLPSAVCDRFSVNGY